MGIDEKTRQAAFAQIRQFGDPVLKEKSYTVTPDDEVRRLVERMIKIMYAADGVGLAAPQIGILRRIIVFRLGKEEPQVLLNPEIVWQCDEMETEPEGCLSFASLSVDVPRCTHVKVAGEDLEGNRRELDLEDIEARILQHEIDHLNGIMIVNRTTPEERKRLMARLRQLRLPGEE